MLAIRSLIFAGVTALVLASQPVKADPVDNDLKMIYNGIYSLYDKAEAGDPRAAFYVASLYLNGIFLPADSKTGMKFLEAAAAKENPDALYYLGLHYQHGMYDYAVDEAKAAKMIRRAAELGQPAAQIAVQYYNMGQ